MEPQNDGWPGIVLRDSLDHGAERGHDQIDGVREEARTWRDVPDEEARSVCSRPGFRVSSHQRDQGGPATDYVATRWRPSPSPCRTPAGRIRLLASSFLLQIRFAGARGDHWSRAPPNHPGAQCGLGARREAGGGVTRDRLVRPCRGHDGKIRPSASGSRHGAADGRRGACLCVVRGEVRRPHPARSNAR
jgi:hypothetical protein